MRSRFFCDVSGKSVPCCVCDKTVRLSEGRRLNTKVYHYKCLKCIHGVQWWQDEIICPKCEMPIQDPELAAMADEC